MNHSPACLDFDHMITLMKTNITVQDVNETPMISINYYLCSGVIC